MPSPGQVRGTTLVGTINKLSENQWIATKGQQYGSHQLHAETFPKAVDFIKGSLSEDPIIYEDTTQHPSIFYLYARSG